MPDVLRKIGIFDGSLGFSAEVSNLPSKILIFRGTFESSTELFDFPRNQITTSAQEKIVQESFAVDSDFLKSRGAPMDRRRVFDVRKLRNR